MRREDSIELDLLEFGKRKASLPELTRPVGEPEVQVAEVREKVRRIVP